ncbi:putative aryl-alcohol dehydrogenase Aad16p [Diutina catenulata]
MDQIKYNRLGDSGLFVAPIIVGCMTFGKKSWANWVVDDKEEVFSILKFCYDQGLRTFDTADVYSNGESERLLGEFLRKYNIPRHTVQILSKVYFYYDENAGERFLGPVPDAVAANKQGLSRKHIIEGVKASVERLGTHIDLLQIHRLDNTPKEEIMRALNDVVEQGLTHYIGASSMRTGEFAQLQAIAAAKNYHKFVSMQSYYNLLAREDERELIPFCNDNIFGKVGLIPWSPIARGVLTRPINTASDTGRDKGDPMFKALGLDTLSDADKTIISRVESVAEKHGVSMAVVASAWVRAKGCSPIVGLSSHKRILDILKALTLELSDSELEYLEEPYKPRAPYI